MHGKRARVWVLAAAVLVLASGWGLPAAATVGSPSLYEGPSPRPGPDVLYWPLATAPQLTNGPGIWHSPPILVSGTTAYRGGEFLYQDWIYDDRGAAGGFNCCRDTGNVRTGLDPPGGNGGENVISPSFGTYTYPQTRPTYAENAADLVELRVKPTSSATAFRVTLNTLTPQAIAGDAVAFTIALARCPGGVCPTLVHRFPHGANSQAPADVFVTVHGATGELVDTSFPKVGASPVTVTVDQVRRQVEVLVPKSDLGPGHGPGAHHRGGGALECGCRRLPRSAAKCRHHPSRRHWQPEPSHRQRVLQHCLSRHSAGAPRKRELPSAWKLGGPQPRRPGGADIL